MFVNMKITFHLENATALKPGRSAMDAILATLWFNRLKHEGSFNGNYAQPLPFVEMSDGVYHTSFPVFEGVSYYDRESLIKRFDHDLYRRFGTISKTTAKGEKKALGTIVTQQGPNKNELFSIERIRAERVVYYVRGDRAVIESLLERFRYLGKKSSLGWGKISRTEISETAKDYSLVRNRKLMRNLPLGNSLGAASDKVDLFRLTHPYWMKRGLEECYLP